MNVLFVCTGNACRSILSEALFNHASPAHWRAYSAGSRPAGTVHPATLNALSALHIASEGLYSKAIADIVSRPLAKTSNADMKALQLNMQDMRGQKRVLDQRKAQVEGWYD